MVAGVTSSAGRFRLLPLAEEFDGVGEGTETLGTAEEDLRNDMTGAGRREGGLDPMAEGQRTCWDGGQTSNEREVDAEFCRARWNNRRIK